MTSRRFLPLFITQFLGAFNDNLLKNSLVIMITYKLAMDTGDNPQILVTLAAGFFILPFFLFSATAGQLADKYERTKIIRIVKAFEILIMALACIGFLLHHSWFLIVILFAAGTHSTFFGPIKYALLPQHLQDHELISGNAYISAGTFIAILLGTICGGLLILQDDGETAVSMLLTIMAACGFIACLFIPLSPAPDPKLKINKNILKETIKIIKYSHTSKIVFSAILAVSWFWFLGITFLTQFPSYVKFTLHAESKVVTIFLTLFTLGIGLGSLLSSKMLNGAIKATFVPFAAIGMAIFSIDLYFASQSIEYFNLPALLAWQTFVNMQPSYRVMGDLILLSVCAGVYIVPLYAIVQHKSDDKYRARILAANNIINSLFMVFSAVVTVAMLSAERKIPEIFLLVGITNILVAYLIYTKISRVDL